MAITANAPTLFLRKNSVTVRPVRELTLLSELLRQKGTLQKIKGSD